MMLFVNYAKGGFTGLLWHTIGTNGTITGARSTVRRSAGVKVFRLESENAVLKANIPEDVLRKIVAEHTC
ncbi:hypothetical protein RB195_024420 [Necator americanus]|uniref:ADF-H domain-containing protein n=1 Tax=Necator americanus TaxID=51031 RepID=A0ABR1EN40_NECAM